MRLDRSELSKAVQTALSLGAVAAVGVAGTAFAQNATTTQSGQQQPQTLQTIVVTGSHIRRVDLETSNPVMVVSAQQIKASGQLTLGNIVQQLPSIAGAATNPQVNNGGGTGASTVSLRGLGSSRTLVLVDGHRFSTGAPVDINSIPTELVERIEILSDGASAVYGSDAVGGVVNIILKKNYQGADFGLDYGISDRDDAERQGFHFTFGQTSDKGSVIAGIDYNKTAPVVAGNRDYSKCAETLSSGHVLGTPCVSGDGGGGSLASISGLITAPAFAKNCPGVPQLGGIGAGTYSKGSPASGSIPANFRCFNPSTDLYNYQAVNVDLTAQERTNAYFSGTYNLTDNVQAYLDVFVNRTRANSQVAPQPLDLYGNLTVAQGQPYNPFPYAIGTGGKGDLAVRMLALGYRITNFRTQNTQIIGGLKGNIGDTGWQWDANLNFGHTSTLSQNSGFLNASALQASGDLDADCATASVDGCLNIFDQTDPTTAAILSKYNATPFFNSLDTMRSAEVDVNGPLFHLPAGDMQLAVGADYRKYYADFSVDPLAIADANGNCGLPNSSCASPVSGGYNQKEVYAELFIPILKDLPFFHALNLTLGDRYSKYSLAGSTNNYKIGLEWRPIEDLLLRGTVSEVFRAPTISNMFAGPAVSYDPYVNPCTSADDVPGSSHYVFCQHDGGTAVNGNQIATITSGSVAAGTALAPEYGKSFDFGAVYSPHFVPGLTLTADLWRVYLHNSIALPTGNTAADICYAANDPSNPYCASIVARGGATGPITTISSPTANLGELWVKGVDMSADYRIPEVSWLPGQFDLSAQATYLGQYDNDPTPGLPGDQVIHVAGTFNDQYGMFPRWRGLLGVNWQDGPWQASYTLRYLGKYQVGSAAPSQNDSCDLAIPLTVCHYGSWLQSNVSMGYTIQPINTTLMVGVDNVFDKQPNIMYQNNTLNANTDPSTFDLIGRFYWMNVDVKF